MQGMYRRDALGGALFLKSCCHLRYVKDLIVKCFISCIGSVFLSVTCLVTVISVINYCRIVALSTLSSLRSLCSLRSLLKKWLVIFELSIPVLQNVVPYSCFLMGV